MHSFLLLLNIVDGYILHLRNFYTNIEGGVESFQSTAAHEFSSKCGCAAGGQDICMGRSDKPPGKGWSMLTRSIFSLRIGWIDLFSKFVTRPVMLLPNISNISLTACSSFWFGLMKIAASSTYREVLNFVVVRGSGVSTPCRVARSRISFVMDQWQGWRALGREGRLDAPPICVGNCPLGCH